VKKEPLVDNAADARQVREAKKKERLQLERHIADVRLVAKTPAGKRLLWEYMDQCDVFAEISGAMEWVYFDEGRRAMGLMLLRDLIAAAPEVLVELMSEGMARDNREKQQAQENADEQEEEQSQNDSGKEEFFLLPEPTSGVIIPSERGDLCRTSRKTRKQIRRPIRRLTPRRIPR
jgi:hypothetical protein